MDRHDNRQEDDRRQQGTTLAIQAIHLRSNQDVMIKLFVLDTTAPHASKSSLPHMIKLFVLDTLATLKEFSKGSDRAHRPCAQRTWLLAFSSWLLAFSSWLLGFMAAGSKPNTRSEPRRWEDEKAVHNATLRRASLGKTRNRSECQYPKIEHNADSC